ncbi:MULTISPECIES: VOC family protein [Arthrobacter]|uniref:VOC family protein n=2 Tax=Arthrobacter TaxID=1663 RepID=A0ABU9KGC0_9MICC|nr:VOC family protein [Arthrobacter sp. YJM1]MDP5225864.1 VOC family protein [Arthrobacter sp. YJM1]
MASTLNPYINFKDTARQAMEFYQSVLGGELTVSTFADLQASQDPTDAEKVMHSQLSTPAGFTLMASDTPAHMESRASGGFAISLSGNDDAELRGYWDKLSDGGQVTVPLEKQMWGDSFGMLVDRFGIEWMVNIAGA